MEALQPFVCRPDPPAAVVALTFDDGPSEWTASVLELLLRYSSSGTFFVIGRELESSLGESIVHSIVSAGGEVGNHSFTHPGNIGELPTDTVREELRRTSERIEAAAGVRPRFWRAPHFRSSLGSRVVAAGLGLREAGASVIPDDYVWPAERTAEFVLASLQPGDVVDLHDGRPRDEPAGASAAGREETVGALELILAGMQERGLRSVTLSELAQLGGEPTVPLPNPPFPLAGPF
jgi:peptidoglycan-N-acetylglucosamine deacetylase